MNFQYWGNRFGIELQKSFFYVISHWMGLNKYLYRFYHKKQQFDHLKIIGKTKGKIICIYLNNSTVPFIISCLLSIQNSTT